MMQFSSVGFIKNTFPTSRTLVPRTEKPDSPNHLSTAKIEYGSILFSKYLAHYSGIRSIFGQWK